MHTVAFSSSLDDLIVQRKNWKSNGYTTGIVLLDLLFSFYVNGVRSSVHHGGPFQCAGDTTLCSKANSIRDLEIVHS